MKLRASFLAVALLSVAAHQSLSAEPEQAMNNLSHEYAECSAYFLVVSVAMENSNRADLAERYKEVSDVAFGYATTAAEQIGLLPETTRARYEMAFLEMSKRLAGNTSNIAILGRDYAEPCQIAMEDVQSRVDYWMAH